MKRSIQRGKIILAALLLAAGGLLGLTAPPALALLGGTPTLRAVSVGRAPGVVVTKGDDIVALIGTTPTGMNQLIVRVIEHSTGKPIGADVMVGIPADVTPVDLLYSMVFKPDSVLVLDSNLNVHEFMIAFDAAGSPKLAGTAKHSFGLDPLVHGHGTALAEAPGVVVTKGDDLLGIGTDTGHVAIVTAGIIVPCGVVGTTAVLDLAAVPQVGGVAFVALTFDKGMARLTGVIPDSDSTTPGLQPGTIFQLADPRPHPFFDLGAVFEPNGDGLADPEPVSLVAADGTSTVYRLTIPASPTLGGALTVGAFEPLSTAISQVEVGSLYLLPADGSGLLLDPGFNVAAGGISGTLLTVVGSSLELSPKTLNLSSKGNYITGLIEVGGGGAAAIDPASVRLSIGGGLVPPSSRFAPQAGDEDKDGIADLKVKFDRAAVQALIPSGATSATATASFSFTDGSTGSASAAIRVLP